MGRFGRFAASLTAGCLLLAGCGGHKPVMLQKAADAHTCAAADYFMQCAHPTKPATPLRFGAGLTARGVDFAWGGPSCSTLHANGWSFGASYLSFDGSKNWSHAQFNDYMRGGCKAVFVWETGSTRATDGQAAGAADARSALAQYRSYIPSGRVVIYFAIDCDCNGGQVDGYFRGVDSVLGAGQAGAYGGITPLNYLFSAHLIDWGWQTYAWSGGAWNGSQLEQYLNDNSVDYDRAIAADYGQWPPPAAPPQPVEKCLRQPYPRSHTCGMVRYGYNRTLADLAKVNSRLAEHHCRRVRGITWNPLYCRGWAVSQGRDQRNVADFRRLYA